MKKILQFLQSFTDYSKNYDRIEKLMLFFESLTLILFFAFCILYLINLINL